MTNIKYEFTILDIFWMFMFGVSLLTTTTLVCIRQYRDLRYGVSPSNEPMNLRESVVRSVGARQRMDARKKYLARNLITRRVVLAQPPPTTISSIETDDTHEDDASAETNSFQEHKGDLILPASSSSNADDAENDSEDDDRPICAICVSPYEVGDAICWSNNPQCNHSFHKNCIEKWLMRHSECPCCRLPYLVPPREGGAVRDRVNGYGTCWQTSAVNQGETVSIEAQHRRGVLPRSSSPLSNRSQRRNIRFSAADEDAFQRMVASLRSFQRSSSFRSNARSLEVEGALEGVVENDHPDAPMEASEDIKLGNTVDQGDILDQCQEVDIELAISQADCSQNGPNNHSDSASEHCSDEEMHRC